LSFHREFLKGLEPPIQLQLEDIDPKEDKIVYMRKKPESLTAKEIKALEKRSKQREQQLLNKRKFNEDNSNSGTNADVEEAISNLESTNNQKESTMNLL
jgi:hypothetical protein